MWNWDSRTSLKEASNVALSLSSGMTINTLPCTPQNGEITSG